MANYGQFNEKDEFEITDPYTPAPWIHYLIRPNQPGQQTFCSGVSHAGGGFDIRGTHENTFIDTKIHLNDKDDIGRYIYIYDKKEKDIFSTTWQPVRKKDQKFKTTMGFGSITFESQYKGIETKEVMFVPEEFDGWVQDVTITNTTDEVKELSLFPFVPIHMGDALVRLMAGDNDGFFGGASFDKDLKAIVFRRNHGTAVNDDKKKINGMLGNVAAFYSTLNTDTTEFETSRIRFNGNRFNDGAAPESVQNNKLSCKEQPYMRDTCGVFKNEITLKPGESLNFAVALVAGSTQDYYLNNKQQLGKLLRDLNDGQRRMSMLDNVKKWWDMRMSKLQINSPDEKINRGFKWLQYQCMAVFILNRMKSRYHTGYEYGWGFRDILQDVLFNLTYGPDEVKSTLSHVATQMFSDGICYHNFFIDQPGNKSIQASDDPYWLPNAVIKYCKETADFDFLDKVVDYAEVHEGQQGVNGTIMEHCLRAVERLLEDRSPRGLPYMKDCDWNDDLNEMREENKPNTGIESVMVAQQLYKILKEMGALFKASGKNLELVEKYDSEAEKLKTAIKEHALDKDGYFKRVLSLEEGKQDVGTSDNEYAKIFVSSQAFGVLCDVADKELEESAMSKVEQYLDTEFGAELCYPAYTDLAEKNILPTRTWNIEKEPPGIKENGSIFMHLNAWLVQAYAKMGKGKKAADFYFKCLPENLASDHDRYNAEPYVYPEYVAGRASQEFGKGGHTWLTGTAPTMHQALVEFIFGLQPEYAGLAVNPSIDPSWKSLSITRNFRGAVYEITISNPNGAQTGVTSISVDGEKIEGNVLPVFNDGKVHKVEVVM
ncbi:N,N'-diacetylchitobiose/cellobiose phosphorylase [Chitinispirillum alkaliphilum]|nr:N,N'-diacetylchitobiose/cellobiose phosphorylase [Chitinispirillum alkaliphilum]